MSDLEDLIAKFNSCSLPKEKWTHEAHLIVAVWFCKTYELPKALNLLRYQIKTLAFDSSKFCEIKRNKNI
jgi:hypothetical protein